MLSFFLPFQTIINVSWSGTHPTSTNTFQPFLSIPPALPSECVMDHNAPPRISGIYTPPALPSGIFVVGFSPKRFLVENAPQKLISKFVLVEHAPPCISGTYIPPELRSARLFVRYSPTRFLVKNDPWTHSKYVLVEQSCIKNY